jgi:transcription elongation factor Elf1
MRCLSCNKALSDAESVRKTHSGMFLDLCTSCHYEVKDLIDVFSSSDDIDVIEKGIEAD